MNGNQYHTAAPSNGASNGSVETTHGNGSGSKVPDVAPAKAYHFPKSKQELNHLLNEYQYLSKQSNELKQQFEQQAQDNGEDLKPSTFVDANKESKLKIESLLFQVSQKYDSFTKEKSDFFDGLLEMNQKSVDDSDLDKDLLMRQITSLQLLSKDLDLPQTLQQHLQESIGESDSEEIELASTVFEELFSSKYEYSDYVAKLLRLGIDVSESSRSTDSLGPAYDKLGGFYPEHLVSAKISNRIQDLENVPLNLGTLKFGEVDASKHYDELKIKSLIELKALKLLAKQKQLKKFLVNYQANEAHTKLESLKNDPLINQSIRSFYIRSKIEVSNPESLAIKLEERRKADLEKEQHKFRLQKIQRTIETIDEFNGERNSRFNKRQTFIKAISSFHSFIEKDETRKSERIARQRLQALKDDDVEGYMQLLDEAKDHRITHLLKQTNQFLDTLAQAVKSQQIESGVEIPLEAGAEKPTSDDADDLREKIDYYQVAHRIKEEVKVQPSILVGGSLKEYQVKGLQWMVSLYNNKLNGILADEMGLGKTIQSISLVTYLIEKKHEDKFLVIVPLSTITNWTLEFEKWAPSVKIIVYKGSQNQRREMQPEVRAGNFQVILTTYEYIIRERPILSKFEYSHMIIDEGHRMKNADSKLSITLRTYYKTKNRLILTGTPLQNNLPELWALLNFVLPRIFNSAKSFDEWFNTPFANTGTQEKIELTEEESLLVIRRLHKVLRPFLLRRLKKDVEKDLPDKVEKVLKCNLSGLQYILYEQMLKHNALFVGAGVGSNKSGIKGLNNKIMQLRKICNHPFVFEEVEAVLNSSRLTNDLIWRTSGKFEMLDRILPKFLATGHRVLMFFQMTQVMDIMEDFLRWREMKFLRLDGSTKAEDRQDMLKEFNAPNSEYFCFLLSTRAGGLGLNLQTADTVIIFDTDWNPHQDLQAQDRAHRIGQKNEVRILRLITNDSVEEVILERAHQKLDIDGKVIQAGKFDNKSTAEEQEEFLKRLLEAEGSGEETEEKNMLDDDELNDVLARSDPEKEIFAKMDIDRMTRDKMNGIQTRLIQAAELPKIFTEDVSHHFEKDTKELSKMRVKKRVRYDDGLTEEQWLMAMDDDNDSVEAAIRRKEMRASKRRRKKLNGVYGLDDDEDEGEDDEDEDGEYETSRRKSRRSATPNSFKEEDENIADEDEEDEVENALQIEGNRILEQLDDLVAEDGHKVTEVFEKLPSRKLYPDYYKIIPKPVSINQISKNLKSNKYFDISEMKQDLLTMCSNAKTYNEEGSWIYTDADTIEQVVNGV
ncbi:hypothetical protein CANTEDRAFT_120341 [Yamadazyma tenuis ATCC 10573]|uniref:Uncharacterized protein n=1 Tax=Candida tenuis (strain ATCC 10573 / BCRC 21748 / CBS 615 / JCM 9827 / NBRC 10315 / NRRL Y-1498 / VKM Y-70) TaxID=590646 RepID=G3B274_CANTC|nr:uncharacterized protein CANTEDRAFT_120341 [Yamadazyma tenuis ATCC 10573]XP_006686008.1 uncharacterized protein CANTEDRAFT_120341 [Yamadazyma tenuis ATCC 10573]EGV65201.1 hypothetical protein CANTEDRAFT_120341 [Yamadazyma tenuis ATCC 10573]EGV65202.1 hypothetical protein CANTEDRAFT_120341 [Yamadazyma tenuis ATCC 10573]